MTILVVDDYEPFVLAVTELLLLDKTKDPPKVLQASDCAAVLDLIKKEPVDCILMDQKLGRSKGIHCIHEIRQGGYKGALVMLTGYTNEMLALEAMKMGADDFLYKDKVLASLVSTIDKAIAKRKEVVQTEMITTEKQKTLEKLLAEMDKLAMKVKAHLARK